jgi:HlyD family secretion protein
MKHLISLLCLLGLASVGPADEPGSDKPKWTFRTAVVKRGAIEATVRATGTLEPEEVVDVGAQVAGQVEKFGRDPRDAAKTIDFGTPVEEGTVLAQIDPALYQADVEHAQTGLKRAEAELQLAMAQCKLAERDWARARELDKKLLSPADLDAYESKYEVAKANVEVSKAAVLQARATLKRAEINLGYCTIRSPIKGVIVDRRVNVGQTVVASLSAPSLFLIARDLKRMQVWVSVSEADIGQIRKGQAVTFTVDAYPDKVFRGEVNQIRLNAAMAQGVVTYTVVATTDNPEGKLLPYMTANVQFVVERRQNAFLVPNGALRWRPTAAQVAPDHRAAFERSERRGKTDADSEHGVVWVEEKGFVWPVQVRTGLTDGAWTEIVASRPPLDQGQEVVTGAEPAAPEPDREQGRAPDAKKILAGLEVRTLLVQPAGVTGGTFLPEEAVAIARECPAVSAAAPVKRLRTQVTHGDRSWVPLFIYGTTPSYLEVRDWQTLKEGDPFTDRDVRGRSKVCLIGQTLVHELFGDASPVGKTVRVQGVSLKVVGVLGRKGANLMGLDQDDVLLAPWTTLEALARPAKPDAGKGGLADLYPGPPVAPYPDQPGDALRPKTPAALDQILVRARSVKDVPAARGQITDLLRQRHHIRKGQPDDFNIRDYIDLAKALESKTR